MANHSSLGGRISAGEFSIISHFSFLQENYRFPFFSSHASEKQRAQKVFKAQIPLDLAGAKNKLSGFGMQLLDGIDPNPDNMVCAGIIHTATHQVGCLLRLEPNKQAQVSVRDSFVSFRTFRNLLSDFTDDFHFSDVPVDCARQQRERNDRNLRTSRRSVLNTSNQISFSFPLKVV